MKHRKNLFLLLPLMIIFLSECTGFKGGMEEQTGGGTASDEGEYTEFAAKGVQAPNTYLLTIHVSGMGKVKIVHGDSAVFCAQPECEPINLEAGALVSLTAIPEFPGGFIRWESVECESFSDESIPCGFKIMGNRIITARFTVEP